MIKSFANLNNSDVFRWPGGFTQFVKVTEDAAVVDGKPNLVVNPSPWEEVVWERWVSLACV